MENAFRGAIFGKKTSIYNFIEKSTPLQISFNCFVYILEAHPSKQTSKKKLTILKFTVCYMAILFQTL